jgi:hypothetical protein
MKGMEGMKAEKDALLVIPFIPFIPVEMPFFYLPFSQRVALCPSADWLVRRQLPLL